MYGYIVAIFKSLILVALKLLVSVVDDSDY